ncbi:MAG: hypothetical protein B7X43_02120 [Thiomonas sp. 15-63-373]|nr:MAG: hypothetical protein B7X43_02120 [Thiomonas sp. 15-63-373]VDY10345.1 protein of unknown function [Thiomonas sp. Sup16B3]VDY16190.1 protein of unknown function [Thiomonas sp. CB2]
MAQYRKQFFKSQDLISHREINGAVLPDFFHPSASFEDRTASTQNLLVNSTTGRFSTKRRADI